VEYDDRKITPIDEEPGGYYTQSYLYSYYDDRMDIYITIDYPQIYSKDNNDLETQINAELRKAFLSFYDSEIYKESEIDPAKEAYGLINRNYIITRADESYLSIRIFTYSDFRAGAHPSDGETGITINRKTGEVLCLQDVVGEYFTPISLLDTGKFHIEPQEEYSEAINEQWFQMLHEYWERNDGYSALTTLDSEFYLTPDSLGLITSLGNEYMRIEATFTDLGITFP
jgi:hypothetical protein